MRLTDALITLKKYLENPVSQQERRIQKRQQRKREKQLAEERRDAEAETQAKIRAELERRKEDERMRAAKREARRVKQIEDNVAKRVGEPTVLLGDKNIAQTQLWEESQVEPDRRADECIKVILGQINDAMRGQLYDARHSVDRQLSICWIGLRFYTGFDREVFNQAFCKLRKSIYPPEKTIGHLNWG
jgi:hypothetical protein